MNKRMFLPLTESCFVCENFDVILLKARISRASRTSRNAVAIFLSRVPVEGMLRKCIMDNPPLNQSECVLYQNKAEPANKSVGN